MRGVQLRHTGEFERHSKKAGIIQPSCYPCGLTLVLDSDWSPPYAASLLRHGRNADTGDGAGSKGRNGGKAQAQGRKRSEEQVSHLELSMSYIEQDVRFR